MTLDQIIGLSGIPLFTLFFLNYAFMVYVATYKLKEMQSHFKHSRFVASHRGDASTPLILRTGNLVLIWSLLVFKFFRKMDPNSIEEVKHFPRNLRPWVMIPGHINACCIVWGFGVLVWINIKGYL
ncbi:hypothetical protein C1884_13060 [Pseudomonas sp. GW460-R15]|uniref:hypothetical protein n=1 Tax=Pseudomonas sp. GW460-R15 TaxID=2075557 RepID=UPI000CD168A0|nr:hypothetical protein [Pseudomonas sp. GW460-R15]POA30322.1 hypothetical protein C1887_16400 [Pseudomonas sp. GW456-R21]POA67128.1 hypothetical protein C1884_13060 [Pseudomonas sp. GW460-R15]